MTRTGAPTRPSSARPVIPIPIGHLVPNPYQPRFNIDEEDLIPLVESIRRYGFLGHIEVRRDPVRPDGPYQIVFGHRRVEAAKRAGLATVPAVVADRTDEQMRRITFIENVARKGLSYWEEAVYLGAMKRELGLSVRQLAEALGVSRTYVQERLDLLKLPPGPLREAAENDEISFSVAWFLLQMPPEEQDQLLAQVRAGAINVSDLRMLRRARARRQAELAARAEEDPAPVPDVTPPTVRLSWVEPPSPLADAAMQAQAARATVPVAEEPSPAPEPTPKTRETRVVIERTLLPRLSPREYAVEVIKQLEANAYHLRLKLEKAAFEELTEEERLRLEQAKAEMLEVLDLLP